MPTITAIKPQKNKKGVNIYLDGKFAFRIGLEGFVKSRLKIEQKISDKRIKEIISEAKFQEVYSKLLNFVTMRPRSESEIKSWMVKKKVNEILKDKLIKKIKKLGLADDGKFARWWIEQRLAFKNKSLFDLKNELRAKGIKKEVVEDILAEVNIDELSSAKKLVEKNMYKWSRFPERIAKQKINGFLSRKGFSWETIRKVIKVD